MTTMIEIGEAAQTHFRKLLAQQALPGLGVRVFAVAGGTPKADVKLAFCEPSDLRGDEWAVDCDGFTLFVDGASAVFLDGASIDWQQSATGGTLAIRAPKLKGQTLAADAPLAARVLEVIEREINPGLAQHGGRCQLEAIEADGVVVLRFGGGCHGCGMVETTVRDGIERTLKAKFPEITGVRDATDHATGAAPYMPRA